MGANDPDKIQTCHKSMLVNQLGGAGSVGRCQSTSSNGIRRCFAQPFLFVFLVLVFFLCVLLLLCALVVCCVSAMES